MKWFQHMTDSHTNGKMRQVLRKQGLEGYAVAWICRELVGKEGVGYRLRAEKDWKTTLKEVTGIPPEKIDKLLQYQAEVKLIHPTSLKRGDLYIPKMREYSDDYTKRVRRVSVDPAASVHVDKNTIDNIIREYITLKALPTKGRPDLLKSIYSSQTTLAKRLYLSANRSLPEALDALRALGAMFDEAGWERWTLGAVNKWFPHYLKALKRPQAVQELETLIKKEKADATPAG